MRTHSGVWHQVKRSHYTIEKNQRKPWRFFSSQTHFLHWLIIAKSQQNWNECATRPDNFFVNEPLSSSSGRVAACPGSADPVMCLAFAWRTLSSLVISFISPLMASWWNFMWTLLKSNTKWLRVDSCSVSKLGEDFLTSVYLMFSIGLPSDPPVSDLRMSTPLTVVTQPGSIAVKCLTITSKYAQFNHRSSRG